ncbi:protein of unknown function [Hyphomicrobium sp. MC1]|nr:protein of unknown function [Hyphomicrobium sp. MC1]
MSGVLEFANIDAGRESFHIGRRWIAFGGIARRPELRRGETIMTCSFCSATFKPILLCARKSLPLL